MTTKNITDRIRKLLALAGNNPSEAEAHAAMSMARKLMNKHGIEATDLEEPPDFKGHVCSIHHVGRVPKWKSTLWVALARYLDLYTIRIHPRNHCRVYGTAADVEVLAYLFEVAGRQIDVAAKRWKRSTGERSDRDFCISAVLALHQRLLEEKREQDGDRSTALVAMSRRSKGEVMCQRDLDAEGCRARNTGGKGYCHNEAGAQAGRNVLLTRGVRAKGGGGQRLLN